MQPASCVYFGGVGVQSARMIAAMDDEVLKDIEDGLRLDALSTIEGDTELIASIPDRVHDFLGREDPNAVRHLEAVAREVFDRQRAAEAGWTQATVNDRIDAAFEALNAAGIVAMQNVGQTMSQGWEDVNELADRREAEGKPPRGATFYHAQDLERAVEGRGLLLAFGAYESDDTKHDEASRAIAREVVATLQRYAVPTEWSGAVDERIAILPFEWRRRRYTKAPRLGS